MDLPTDLIQLIARLNPILFWIAVTALLIDGYFVIFHKGVPNIRTAPAIRTRLIGWLQDDKAARQLASYTILDIGSGNGHLTREIARAMPDTQVIGIEINYLSWLWSVVMARRAGLKNLRYIRQDFMTYDFSGAQAVVMFLIPAVLTMLGRKLHEQAAPGTFIMSNKFPLGDGWQPLRVEQTSTLYLHQGKSYLYRKEST